MTYTKLNIEHLITSRYLQFGFAILATLAVITKPLKVRYWRTGLLTKLNKRLNKIYLISEGAKSILNDNTEAQNKINIIEKYTEAESLLNEAQKLYTALEKVDFFNNHSTQELAEGILSNFHSIESKLRHLNYEDVVIPEDEALFEFASQLSLGSLQA